MRRIEVDGESGQKCLQEKVDALAWFEAPQVFFLAIRPGVPSHIALTSNLEGTWSLPSLQGYICNPRGSRCDKVSIHPELAVK